MASLSTREQHHHTTQRSDSNSNEPDEEILSTPELTGRTAAMPVQNLSVRRALISGLCTLLIAMGIGRFAYTPILPEMQSALGLTHAETGLLASLNYLGYLIGALSAGFLTSGRYRTLTFRTALLLSAATTGLMAATDWFSLWGCLRLLSGVISGLLFVICADMVMRVLAEAGKARLAGFYFGGVGIGIALSGLLVPLLANHGGWRADWIGLGVIAAVFALPPFFWLRDRDRKAESSSAGIRPARGTAAERLPAGIVIPLSILGLAYFLEGIGYIISGTFLVAILQTGTESAGAILGNADVGTLAWTMVGIAIVPSCLFWSWAAQRWGEIRAMIAAHLLQAIGIALPLWSKTLAPSLLAAALFGGTFVGISLLVVAYARKIAPAYTAVAIGLMTAAFSLGQILGPLIAAALAERSGSFDSSLMLSSIAVVTGAVLLLFLARLTAQRLK